MPKRQTPLPLPPAGVPPLKRSTPVSAAAAAAAPLPPPLVVLPSLPLAPAPDKPISEIFQERNLSVEQKIGVITKILVKNPSKILDMVENETCRGMVEESYKCFINVLSIDNDDDCYRLLVFLFKIEQEGLDQEAAEGKARRMPLLTRQHLPIKDSIYSNALYAALFFGYFKTAKFLLEKAPAVVFQNLLIKNREIGNDRGKDTFFNLCAERGNLLFFEQAAVAIGAIPRSEAESKGEAKSSFEKPKYNPFGSALAIAIQNNQFDFIVQLFEKYQAYLLEDRDSLFDTLGHLASLFAEPIANKIPAHRAGISKIICFLQKNKPPILEPSPETSILFSLVIIHKLWVERKISILLKMGNPVLLKTLSDLGFDFDEYKEEGFTFFEWIIKADPRGELLSVWYKEKPDKIDSAINELKESPILFAIKKNIVIAITKLLELGASLTVGNAKNWNVLHYAAAYGTPTTIKIIIDFLRMQFQKRLLLANAEIKIIHEEAVSPFACFEHPNHFIIFVMPDGTNGIFYIDEAGKKQRTVVISENSFPSMSASHASQVSAICVLYAEAIPVPGIDGLADAEVRPRKNFIFWETKDEEEAAFGGRFGSRGPMDGSARLNPAELAINICAHRKSLHKDRATEHKLSERCHLIKGAGAHLFTRDGLLVVLEQASYVLVHLVVLDDPVLIMPLLLLLAAETDTSIVSPRKKVFFDLLLRMGAQKILQTWLSLDLNLARNSLMYAVTEMNSGSLEKFLICLKAQKNTQLRGHFADSPLSYGAEALSLDCLPPLTVKNAFILFRVGRNKDDQTMVMAYVDGNGVPGAYFELSDDLLLLASSNADLHVPALRGRLMDFYAYRATLLDEVRFQDKTGLPTPAAKLIEAYQNMHNALIGKSTTSYSPGIINYNRDPEMVSCSDKLLDFFKSGLWQDVTQLPCTIAVPFFEHMLAGKLFEKKFSSLLPYELSCVISSSTMTSPFTKTLLRELIYSIVQKISFKQIDVKQASAIFKNLLLWDNSPDLLLLTLIRDSAVGYFQSFGEGILRDLMADLSFLKQLESVPPHYYLRLEKTEFLIGKLRAWLIAPFPLEWPDAVPLRGVVYSSPVGQPVRLPVPFRVPPLATPSPATAFAAAIPKPP